VSLLTLNLNVRLNIPVIRALARRDLRIYFSSPSGYVFITVFIFLSAAAAFWQDRFFLDNLATLDQLNALFPYLLIFFIPALTMAVWAEERKQGTDELLLTLPAGDIEVVLGKYLATLGVYTAAVALSFSHVLVLMFLGSPDPGLVIGNYVGYWLLGGALIAVGMLASLLTANVTLAFIFGAVFCAVLVMIETTAALFSTSLGRLLEPFGVVGHFFEFSRGVVSFSGLLYFLLVTGVFLYLNVLLIGRRHWPKIAGSIPTWGHQLIRAVAVAIAVISVGVILSRANLRMDLTAEGLHSLSDETRNLVEELSTDRPVFIQAFVSPTVPEQYVQMRSTLLDLLAEIDAVGGAKVEVVIHETEPYTQEARNAREQFGITAREIPQLSSARAGFADVFLGLAFTCGAEEQVIPFFDRGLPAEYEIARSMRVVARTERKRIGVVNSGIRLFGGLDFQTFRSTPPWAVVEELRKQYEVVEITPSGPITEEVDGLVAVLPSSLSQEEMDHLQAYIEQGQPTLLLVDPLPTVDLSLSPSEEPGTGQNPFMQQNQPPPTPKGDIQALLTSLGVRWDSSSILWDAYNPHPDLAHLPPEVVFIGRGNQSKAPFNLDHRSTAELQELAMLYPGHLSPTVDNASNFEPLVTSSQISGTFPYFQMVQRGFLGAQLNRNLSHRPDASEYVLAAHIRSGDQLVIGESAPEDSEEASESGAGSTSINAIVVADLDFISQQFFQIRQMGAGNLNFDNVTFFLNAIDVLVGDESFVTLRNRRVRHRTLTTVEANTSSYIEQRAIEEQQAESEADQALAEAQSRLDTRVQEVQNREDLDQRAKEIMARNLQEVENRRFGVLKTNIEAERDMQIESSKETMESQIRNIQSSIRTFAVLLPPIPVFALGVMVFIRRQRRERASTAAIRRVRT